MKRKSLISLALIVLSVFIVLSSSINAANGLYNDKTKLLPFLVQQENRQQHLEELPDVARNKISRQLFKSEYDITKCEKTLPSGRKSIYRSVNRSQNLTAYYSDRGIFILPNGKNDSDWHLEMALKSFGYNGAMTPTEAKRSIKTKVTGKRVEFQRGMHTEWYLNSRQGLEQGVKIDRQPGGKKDGPLVVEWTVSGPLTPRIDDVGNNIVFIRNGVNSVLHYGDIKAWDATGRLLPAKLALNKINQEDQKINISYLVDDTDASYPLTIDPVFTQSNKLLPIGPPSKFDHFGYNVSISGDTVVVGAPDDDDNGSGSGSVYIFYRNQGGPDNWGEVKKVTANDGAQADYFGYSVAISGDTLLVGARADDDLGTTSGSAYVFYRDQGGMDNWGEVQKLLASDGAASDYFGNSVAVSGDTVIVGAYRDDDSGNDSGSTYIFYRDQGGPDNWGEVQKILAADGAASDYFGYSVAVSADIVIVGAHQDDDNGSSSGSAYIFYRDQGGPNNWGEVKKITAGDGAASDFFGFSVAISQNTIAAGAYRDDDNGTDSGSAYIFYRDEGGVDNWGETQKIIPSDGAGSDKFGYSVSIDNDSLLVGAYNDDDFGANSGSAYIFYRDQGGVDNWGEVRKIAGSDAKGDDYFGFSVSISTDTVVVGAYKDDDYGSESGSTYVFNSNQGGVDNWGQVQKLAASDGGIGDLVSDGSAYDYFGSSVAISGDTMVIGAHEDDDNGVDSGSAYVFNRTLGTTDDWTQVKKITPDDASAGIHFGYSVAINGNTLVVGAYNDNENGTNSGSAYVFYRDEGGANNWGQVHKVAADDGSGNDYFGSSVAVSGDIVVVGAIRDDDNGADSGSAYIFYRDTGGPDNWGQVHKLTADDGAAGDYFGGSVAISGDTVVVGAYRLNDNFGTDRGASYIYYRNEGGADNWGQVKKLYESLGLYFGHSVDIDGDTIVIGGHYDTSYYWTTGRAYIFYRDEGGKDNWGRVAVARPSDGDDNDFFGYSVAVSGNTVVVGATQHDENGGNAGAAYIFDRNQCGADSWGQVKKLTAEDSAMSDRFGSAVAISGNTIVVGTPYDDDNNTNSGSAYTYYYNISGFREVQKITPSDGTEDNFIGYSLAVNGNVLVVGVPSDDEIGVNAGAVYIFEHYQNGAEYWVEEKKIMADDGLDDDNFGYSVAISGDTFVAAALHHGANGQDAGGVYIFNRNQGGVDNWGLVKKIIAEDGTAEDFSGCSVAIHDDTLIVGAGNDDGIGPNSGSVYIYYRNQGGFDNWGRVKKIVASDGTGGDYFGFSVDIDVDTVVVGMDFRAAYIFDRHIGGTDNWGEVQIITPIGSIGSFTNFGHSVAISGNTAVVGSYGDEENGVFSGAAYVFERDQGGLDFWGQMVKLIAIDGAGGDNFGYSVDISGGKIVIGSPHNNVNYDNDGVVYIFDRNRNGSGMWGELEIVPACDGYQEDRFGSKVSISANTMAIGAPGDDAPGKVSGSVYVFKDFGRGDLDGDGDVDGLDLAELIETFSFDNLPDFAASFGSVYP